MSKKSSTIIFLIVAMLIVVAITLAAGVSSNTPTPTTSAQYETTNPTTPTTVTTPTPPVTGTTSTSKTYKLSEVAKHNSRSDCWTTINGGVYNLTSWIDQHPGGADAIISLCGIDGSSAFDDQHGGQRRPANELAGFKIGVLVK